MGRKRLLGLIGILLLTGAGLLLLFSQTPMSDWLGKPLRVADDRRPADVLVAISAAIIPRCRTHPDLLLREAHGADLVRQGLSKSGKLVISGVYTESSRPGALEACRRYLATRFKLNPAQLVIDNRAYSTYDNAVNVRALMEAHQWQDAVLVTSSSHMYRAVRTFRKQGVRVYPAQIPDKPDVRPQGFDSGRIGRVQRFIYEYGALIKYKWYGYI